jgi:hypothetical protein
MNMSAMTTSNSSLYETSPFHEYKSSKAIHVEVTRPIIFGELTFIPDFNDELYEQITIVAPFLNRPPKQTFTFSDKGYPISSA